jgi:Zn-dependent protease with chaperone function
MSQVPRPNVAQRQSSIRVYVKTLRATALLLAITQASPELLQARVEPTHGFNMFSEQEEIQAGKQASEQVQRQMPVLPESDPVSRYVERLGQELASHAPGEPWPYTFHVVNQNEINAFALPGGPVFVNLGTIRAAENEAQLAGVLAHEISHVVQRHGTRNASKQMAAQLPLAILGGVFGRGALAQAAQLGLNFGVGSYLLKNSRQSESEADLLGADIMYDTGYDPHQMAAFFDKIEQQSRSHQPQFLSDHPDPGNRAQAVSQEVATLPRKTVYRSDSSEFLEAKNEVDGMRSRPDENSERRYSGGGIPEAPTRSAPQTNSTLASFQHRDYAISYPNSWKLFGDRYSATTIAPQNGLIGNSLVHGVMISSYQPENPNSTLDQATHDLLSSLRQSNPDMRQIGSDESIRISGVAGRSADLIGGSPQQVGEQGQERDWLVAFKQHDGSLLYLVFVAPDREFSSYHPVFEQMLESLRLK